jgi:MFS family permease
MGAASFITVIPLFVSSLTSSPILIGLIPAIHIVGWQLPQLLTAGRIARMERYKPAVILTTIHERLPFFFLAAVAWNLASLGAGVSLPLIFVLLVWQGLGGGFTANAWQSMIAKIMPARRRGTFFGIQAAIGNLTLAVGAVIAGNLLESLDGSPGFAACFLIAGISLLISMVILALTREESRPPAAGLDAGAVSLSQAAGLQILRADRPFQRFLLIRNLFQFANLATAFFTVYTASRFQASESVLGWMTAVFSVAQIIANPLLGWLGDRWGHRQAMLIGTTCSLASGLLAYLATGPAWFYPVFILAGFGNVAAWISSIAMTMEFGSESQRPVYIGLSNTLTSPSTLLAPLLGGWLANLYGYPVTFLLSALAALALLALVYGLKRPQPVLLASS